MLATDSLCSNTDLGASKYGGGGIQLFPRFLNQTTKLTLIYKIIKIIKAPEIISRSTLTATMITNFLHLQDIGR